MATSVTHDCRRHPRLRFGNGHRLYEEFRERLRIARRRDASDVYQDGDTLYLSRRVSRFAFVNDQLRREQPESHLGAFQ